MTEAEERGYVKGVKDASSIIFKLLGKEERKMVSAPEHRMREIHECRVAAFRQAYTRVCDLIHVDGT